MNRYLPVMLLVGLMCACAERVDCPPVAQPLPAANAGCLIMDADRVVMVRELSGKISLPGGTSEAGESAQCTAYRETYEETGLQVRVQQRLKVFPNGFNLFRCELAHVAPGESLVPPMRAEIREAFWLATGEFDLHPWRFPDQRAMILDWASALPE